MKFLIRHLWSIILFVVFIVPSAADAFQIGQVSLKPTLSVDETYDSNVTFAETNEISDFITAIAPGIEAIHEGKNRYLKFTGTLHQKLYAKNEDFNNFSQDFKALYKQEFSKYDRITIMNTFLHADQMSSFDDEFGKEDGRYDFYKNYFSGTYFHDFSSQLTGSLKYNNDLYDPSREGLASSVRHMFGLQTDYAISSQIIPFWFYEHSNRNYDPGGTITRNSTGLGAKYLLTETLSLNGKVGADFIDPIGGESVVHPQFMAGVAEERADGTLYGATFTKYYEDSSYDQNLLNSWRFTVNWGRQLMERLQGVLTAFTGGGKFEPDGDKEQLNGFGLVFNYETTRDSTASIGYKFTNRNSSDDTREYDKNTVSVNWKVKF